MQPPYNIPLQAPPVFKYDCDAAMHFLCNGLEEIFAVQRHTTFHLTDMIAAYVQI